MTRAPLALLALAAACGSSAPYTIPAAAINTGLAAGVAASERAAGGCYAICTNGTRCNPRSGWCEPEDSAAFRIPEPGTVCVDAPGGGKRCTPVVVGASKAPSSAPPVGVGISPATGSVPPPPGEASPRAP